jgi:hypothetical protein
MTFLKWQLKTICEKILKNLQLRFSQKQEKEKRPVR